jgi:hypothetical protein
MRSAVYSLFLVSTVTSFSAKNLASDLPSGASAGVLGGAPVDVSFGSKQGSAHALVDCCTEAAQLRKQLAEASAEIRKLRAQKSPSAAQPKPGGRASTGKPRDSMDVRNKLNRGKFSTPYTGTTWFASPLEDKINTIPFVDDQFAMLTGSKTNKMTVISDNEAVETGDYSDCATVDLIMMPVKEKTTKLYEDQGRGNARCVALVEVDSAFAIERFWSPFTRNGTRKDEPTKDSYVVLREHSMEKFQGFHGE